MLGLGFVEGNDPRFLTASQTNPLPFARYRFTATLIFLLLQGGYKCPHQTIDKYVQVFTGFEPTDGTHWTDNEPKLQLETGFITDRVTKLSFDKLGELSHFL